MARIDLLPLIYAVGVALSAYAYLVEYRVEEAKRLGTSYKALCDIGMFSCTKVFTSEYGYLTQFVLPGAPKVSNALLAVGVYAVMIVLSLLSQSANRTLGRIMARVRHSDKASPSPAHQGNMLALFVKTLVVDQFLTGPFHFSGVALGVLALLALGSVLVTAGLFVILTVVLRDLCLVCMSIYVVNISSAVMAVRRYMQYCRARAAIS
jgi:uncharacterized membrane protein